MAVAREGWSTECDATIDEWHGDNVREKKVRVPGKELDG